MKEFGPPTTRRPLPDLVSEPVPEPIGAEIVRALPGVDPLAMTIVSTPDPPNV